jgi:hypothetical protein
MHAHQAGLRFQPFAGQLAAGNRQRFLNTFDRHKQYAKVQRARARMNLKCARGRALVQRW